jgi:hypothetical protein
MTLDIAPVQSQRRMLVGEELLLHFRLFDPQTQRPSDGLGPLRVLVFQPADGWQGHGWAHPVGDGTYEVAFPIPKAGAYYIFLACPQAGVGYAQLPYLILQTSETGTTAISRASEEAPAVYQC